MADWSDAKIAAKQGVASWGHIVRWMIAGMDMEWMEFEEEGSDHSHVRWEHAICLSGRGLLIVEGTVSLYEAGMMAIIPPGTKHRMKPVDDADAPFRWLLFYRYDPISSMKIEDGTER